MHHTLLPSLPYRIRREHQQVKHVAYWNKLHFWFVFVCAQKQRLRLWMENHWNYEHYDNFQCTTEAALHKETPIILHRIIQLCSLRLLMIALLSSSRILCSHYKTQPKIAPLSHSLLVDRNSCNASRVDRLTAFERTKCIRFELCKGKQFSLIAS